MQITEIKNLNHLGTAPIPVYLGIVPTQDLKRIKPEWVWRNASWINELDATLLGCEFRGVTAAALDRVVTNGIDVLPTDSPIFVCGQFDKAWEYGGFPKLIMALRHQHLDWTWRMTSPETPDDELEAILRVFPSRIELGDGYVHHSRFAPDSTAIGTPYETEYARWIPGDPWEALHSIFLFYPEETTGRLQVSDLQPT